MISIDKINKKIKNIFENINLIKFRIRNIQNLCKSQPSSSYFHFLFYAFYQTPKIYSFLKSVHKSKTHICLNFIFTSIVLIINLKYFYSLCNLTNQEAKTEISLELANFLMKVQSSITLGLTVHLQQTAKNFLKFTQTSGRIAIYRKMI